MNDAQSTKEEWLALRRSSQEIKQKYEEKEDSQLRENTRMKILVDETNTQLQNLRNELVGVRDIALSFHCFFSDANTGTARLVNRFSRRNDTVSSLELANAENGTLRERNVELERDVISFQRKYQNLEVQTQNLSTTLQKTLLEKKEIKESRDVMEVELASERNRNNIRELRQLALGIFFCKTLVISPSTGVMMLETVGTGRMAQTLGGE